MTEAYPDPKSVFVIHGRNELAWTAMGVFLRACGLKPINFGELRSEMGGTPTIADIVEEGMRRAQGIVALFTPDEYSSLRPDLRKDTDEHEALARWQARPNVIFEAGMAFGRDRQRVVFVVLGDTKLFTDVAGIHVLRPTNDATGDRGLLHDTLKKGLRCDAEDSRDWMTAGDFEGCVSNVVRVGPKDPFALPPEANEGPDETDNSGASPESESANNHVAARVIRRPQEFGHPYYISSLTLHETDPRTAGQIRHVEHFCKIRLVSSVLQRSSFLTIDERSFMDLVRTAFPNEHDAELEDPDPRRAIVFNTDPDYRYYRCWSWMTDGILGMGTSLPMVVAPDRYSVADTIDDMVRCFWLASEFVSKSDSMIWFELVATGLSYQLERAEMFQSSRLGTPRVYKPGIGSDHVVEKYFRPGTLCKDNIVSNVSEIMQLALAKVHRERLEPDVLVSIAQRQLVDSNLS